MKKYFYITGLVQNNRPKMVQGWHDRPTFYNPISTVHALLKAWMIPYL